MQRTDDLLTADGLHTYIGRFHILQGVSLTVPASGCTVILGRNGAGKSTTLRTLMGILRPSQGTIRLGDADITGRPAHAVAQAGLGYVPEDRGIFRTLTVEENVRLAERRRGSWDAQADRIFALFPDLKQFWRRLGGALSGGQQQMLAIARALVNDNRLLLVDEPSKGLAPIVVGRVTEALAEIKRSTPVLLVEQNFAMAAALGDGCFVIDSGRTVHGGPMAELVADEALQRRFLGIGEGRTIA